MSIRWTSCRLTLSFYSDKFYGSKSKLNKFLGWRERNVKWNETLLPFLLSLCHVNNSTNIALT